MISKPSTDGPERGAWGGGSVDGVKTASGVEHWGKSDTHRLRPPWRPVSTRPLVAAVPRAKLPTRGATCRRHRANVVECDGEEWKSCDDDGDGDDGRVRESRAKVGESGSRKGRRRDDDEDEARDKRRRRRRRHVTFVGCRDGAALWLLGTGPQRVGAGAVEYQRPRAQGDCGKRSRSDDAPRTAATAGHIHTPVIVVDVR